MTLPGIDISYAQATTPNLTGLDFVFCRAGYGSNSVDSRWSQHSTNVRAAGKVLGAYWFWYENQDNATAVATFLKTAGSADLLALDLEGTNHDTTTGHQQAADFIARIHAAGRKIGLYHSASGFPNLGQDWNWVAQWSTTPPASYTFWQFADTYLGSGANGDSDKFNGTAADLQALIGVQGGTGGGIIIVGFPSQQGNPPVLGTLHVPTGTKFYRLSDGAEYDYSGAPFDREALTAISGPGSNGYHIDLAPPPAGKIETHFCYAVGVTFTPATAPQPPTATTLAPGLYEVK